ncbi:MAG: IclR family transcriptional regulator C-terminal domain-containing protein, partial [Sphingobium sp.]
TRTPMHGFAAGKAILAALSDAEIEAYLRGTERAAFTPTTITASDDLRREIATIRSTGIARTREEHTPGIQGVARAVIIEGETLGAFSVAIPTARFDAGVERRVAELLTKTCGLLVG